MVADRFNGHAETNNTALEGTMVSHFYLVVAFRDGICAKLCNWVNQRVESSFTPTLHL